MLALQRNARIDGPRYAQRAGGLGGLIAPPRDIVLASDLATNFCAALRSAGTDPDHPALREAWKAFLELAQDPIMGVDPRVSSDLLLVEAGGPRPDVPNSALALDMSRQVSFVDDDGEYVDSHVLTCWFVYDPVPNSEALTRLSVWGSISDGGTEGILPWPQFVQAVESSGIFQLLVDRLSPRESGVWLGGV